jgi:hypothetical protein
MDRATGFYPVGWGFESLRAYSDGNLLSSPANPLEHNGGERKTRYWGLEL